MAQVFYFYNYFKFSDNMYYTKALFRIFLLNAVIYLVLSNYNNNKTLNIYLNNSYKRYPHHSIVCISFANNNLLFHQKDSPYFVSENL